MIFERLPKITKVEGGTTSLKSSDVSLDNYRIAAFLFENDEGNSLNIKIKASGGIIAPAYTSFYFKPADAAEFSEVVQNEKILTGGGLFIAAVTADSLGRGEFDRVSIELTSAADIEPVFILQTQPRYENNE